MLQNVYASAPPSGGGRIKKQPEIVNLHQTAVVNCVERRSYCCYCYYYYYYYYYCYYYY